VLKNRVLSFAAVLAITVLLAGCSFLGIGKDQTVQEFFDGVSAAVESLQPNRIVDLVELPITIPIGPTYEEGGPLSIFAQNEGDDDEDEVLEITRDMLIDILDDPLTIARDGGMEVSLDFDWPDGEEIETNIVVDGDTAIVELVYISASVKVSEETLRNVAKELLWNLSIVLYEIEDADEELREEYEEYFTSLWDELMAEYGAEIDWDEELVLLEDAPSGPIELVKDGRKWKFKAFDFGEGLGIL